MFRRPRLCLLLGASLLAVLAAGAAGESPISLRPARPEEAPDEPGAAWREGPIRYIISAEEDKEFKDLSTEEARRRFIRVFWARRDPNPETLVNEFRHTFWERVATANTLFGDSSKPGWKTDMGRFFILLGPPDDRDTTLEQAPGLGRTGVRGVIIWRYSHSPAANIGTGVTIPFLRDASGEFRASTDAAVVQRVLSNAILFPTPTAMFGVTIPEMPPRLSELELLLDLGRLEEVPSVEDLLTAIVTAEEFFGVIPFSARYDLFAGPVGRTLVAITLSLHPDPLDPDRRTEAPDYLIVGRIDPVPGEAEGRPPFFLRESAFSPSPVNVAPDYRGPYMYQAVIDLPPGKYNVSFAAFDRAARKTGAYADTIEIPSFLDSGLGLSSLCLSESIEPIAGGNADPEPYVIGHLKVTPRLRPVYRNGETFAVYYQVYSALTDPATQAPDLVIEYQFMVNQGGAFMPIGRPIRFEGVGNSAQGWSFPLRNWPSAEFKLRVTVTDSLAGESAWREITFRVL